MEKSLICRERAVHGAGDDRDLKLARQVAEFGVLQKILVKGFDGRADVEQLVMRESRRPGSR